MEVGESKRSNLKWWESHTSHENSKWFSENRQEVDQRVKEALCLIEQDGQSLVEKAETGYQKKIELISHVVEFNRQYKLLAERYDLLTGELKKAIPSPVQMESPVFCVPPCQTSSFLSPDQKSGLHKSDQGVNFDLLLSSGGGSSDISSKGDSEYTSSLSDSDSDSSNFPGSKCSNRHLPSERVLQEGFVEMESEIPDLNDKVHATGQMQGNIRPKSTEFGGHEMLLGKITKYDTDLRILNKRLQFSGREIDRLKDELESAQSKIRMLEADAEIEKRKASELQKQIAASETLVLDSCYKVGILEQELKASRETLKDSEEEILTLKQSLLTELSQHTHQLQDQVKLAQKDFALLETELDSERGKVLELQERIFVHTTALSNRENVIRDLNAALCDAQNINAVEKAKLQSEFSSLSERRTSLEAKNKELNLLCQSLERNFRQSESEKMEMKGRIEAQEISWQSEIRKLKDEVHEKNKLVEVLNKNVDMLKFSYDMLMAEKDGVNAKVNTLSAEVSLRDDKIRQIEDHLHQLHLKHAELMGTSEKAQKVIDELRSNVEELEIKVNTQKVLISDGAEEKREAIRQLCFSLEHCRTGYEELRQAYVLGNRPTVLGS